MQVFAQIGNAETAKPCAACEWSQNFMLHHSAPSFGAHAI
jgi:hypothetical protein